MEDWNACVIPISNPIVISITGGLIRETFRILGLTLLLSNRREPQDVGAALISWLPAGGFGPDQPDNTFFLAVELPGTTAWLKCEHLRNLKVKFSILLIVTPGSFPGEVLPHVPGDPTWMLHSSVWLIV